MPVEAFIDTNILVYSVSSHPSEAGKRNRARALIASADFGTSAQVIAEFYVTATQKIAAPLSDEHAMQIIARLIRLPVVAIDTDLVLEAIALRQRHRISYWDASIIAAAQKLGAATIYSEDLNHGQLYGKSRIINPFRTRQ
ncbi:MAG: PIN domain-containing protein [Verrucomicrobiota bacterium]|jgi:predicted nucleic acid-binding protein|nr:PIN domain-containing protein [Verrucomicrobiota bacterium]